MNQSSGETGPKFEVPTPPQGLERQHEAAMEKPIADDSKVGKQQPQATDVTTPLPAPASDTGRPTVASAPTSARSNAPTADLTARDGDRIEKHWVDTAKAIVAQTQDDPYQQKNELSKAGTDYRLKRFNKSAPSEDALAA